jgi:hypothetical protein
MPDDVHGAGLAEADADDDQYGVVIRDSLRDEAEREARAAAYEENKQQNETVDDWLKAVSGVEDKEELSAKGAPDINCFADAAEGKVSTGDTPVKGEPGDLPELKDGIIDVSDGEESTDTTSAPPDVSRVNKEAHVEIIYLSD